MDYAAGEYYDPVSKGMAYTSSTYAPIPGYFVDEATALRRNWEAANYLPGGYRTEDDQRFDPYILTEVPNQWKLANPGWTWIEEATVPLWRVSDEYLRAIHMLDAEMRSGGYGPYPQQAFFPKQSYSPYGTTLKRWLRDHNPKTIARNARTSGRVTQALLEAGLTPVAFGAPGTSWLPLRNELFPFTRVSSSQLPPAALAFGMPTTGTAPAAGTSTIATPGQTPEPAAERALRMAALAPARRLSPLYSPAP